MNTQIGLWIDHRKAAIVAMTEKGEETSTRWLKYQDTNHRTSI